MVRTRIWVLNFDAEDELARPGGHTSTAAVRARFRGLRERVGALLGPDDIALDEGAPAQIGEGIEGIAWCPTPGALRALRQAGAVVPIAPSVEVLRAVNHRRFCARLGQRLPGAFYVDSLDHLDDVLGGPSPTGQWVLKRPFGFAGRGRRVVTPAEVAREGPARAWALSSFRASEGLEVEPWVERLGDFGLHGHIAMGGEVRLGEPTRQACDSRGAWRSSVRAERGALEEAERAALFEEAALTAAALREAGYFGPFGIDAFRWRDASGAARWNPRCEINARYSMGWAVGMGAVRPDLDPSTA